MTSKFYIENAKDRWGNRGFPAAVIEGEIVEGEYFTEIFFKAPEYVASRWPSTAYYPEEWTEVEGLAQLLECWEDCDKYIAEHSVSEEQPKQLPLLKNGTSEVKSLVAATLMSLKSLMAEEPVTFYELVMLCRDSSHKLFGNTGKKLRDWSMIEADGQPHNSVRNIVLSAISGEGLDMKLGNPYMEKGD